MPDSLAFNANFGRSDRRPVAKNCLALLLTWGRLLTLLLRGGGSARLLGRFRGRFGHRSAPLRLALLLENAPPKGKRSIWSKLNLVGSNGKGKTKFCRNSDMLAQNCVPVTTAQGLFTPTQACWFWGELRVDNAACSPRVLRALASAGEVAHSLG